MVDKSLKIYISAQGSSKETSREKPENDSLQPRQILLDSLPCDTIRWGCKLWSIDSELTLHFDHAIEKGYKFLVSADGAWSKVRPFLYQFQPVFSGAGGIELNVPDAENATRIYTSPSTAAPYLLTRTANALSRNKNRTAASRSIRGAREPTRTGKKLAPSTFPPRKKSNKLCFTIRKDGPNPSSNSLK